MLPDKVASKHVKFFLHNFRFPVLRAVCGMPVMVTVKLPRLFCVFPSKFARKRDCPQSHGHTCGSGEVLFFKNTTYPAV